MKGPATVLGIVVLLFALVSIVFGVTIYGTVYIDDEEHKDEEAPCCLMTIHSGTDCTGEQLEATGTDSCGDYAFTGDYDSDAWYGVKAHFKIIECAAWFGYGDCPETIVCDSVYTGFGTAVRHDFYMELDSCYNVGCD